MSHSTHDPGRAPMTHSTHDSAHATIIDDAPAETTDSRQSAAHVFANVISDKRQENVKDNPEKDDTNKDDKDDTKAKQKQGITSERKPVVKNDTFPLMAKWESFPHGSDAHVGIARALGNMGEVVPVKRTREFFSTLHQEGLIDTQGNASEDLKNEVKKKKKMKEEQLNEILNPETNGGLSPELANMWAFMLTNNDEEGCRNCESKGIFRRGHPMTKCECGIYFGS